MRYRVEPEFWGHLERAKITGADVAPRTPNGLQWLYRVRRSPGKTVSQAWMEGAVSAFPESDRLAVRQCFTALPQRYCIKPALWGLLAMRRVKLSALAAKTPLSQQRMHQLRGHPTYTIDEAAMRAVCEALSIDTPARYFAPAPDAWSRKTERPVAVAS